jgi:hypothetical protein
VFPPTNVPTGAGHFSSPLATLLIHPDKFEKTITHQHLFLRRESLIDERNTHHCFVCKVKEGRHIGIFSVILRYNQRLELIPEAEHCLRMNQKSDNVLRIQNW